MRSLGDPPHATTRRAPWRQASVSAAVDERGQEEASAERHGRSIELVAELLDGLDGLGERRQLLAQAPDVDVDRARPAGVVVAPDVAEQEVARQHAALVLDQVLEQQELLGRQPHVLAVEGDGVAIGVDRDRPVAERRAGRGTARAAQQRRHARAQFLRAERLGDVVVGAELEARDAIGFLAARRQHDDRNGGDRRIGAHRLADEQAVHAGQHQVEDDEIGRRLAQPAAAPRCPR